MDADRIDVITEWDAVTFSGGYDGLRSLADRGFTGAVTDGTAWAFLLNGRVVGVADGDLAGFADADGTAYEAPHPSVPLLFAMQEGDAEVRAQYYTNDTPISEADRTLSAGGFTGYIELSDNVLSGDYYVAYYGGESQSCAFVGNASQLVTGTEAFDRADDEVGIYTVYDVDLDVREVPQADAASGAASAGSGTDDDDGSDPGADDDPNRSRTDEGSSEPGDGREGPVESQPADAPVGTGTDGSSATGMPTDEAPGSGEQVEGDQEDPTADDRDGPGGGAQPKATSGTDEGNGPDSDDLDGTPDTANGGTDRSEVGGSEAGGSESAGSEPAVHDGTGGTDADTEPDPVATRDGPGSPGAEPTDASDTADRSDSATTSTGSSVSDPSDSATGPTNSTTTDAADEDVFSEEAEWREAKSIPALDPSDAAEEPSERNDRSDPGRGRRGSGAGNPRSEARSARSSSQRADATPADTAGSEADNGQTGGNNDAEAVNQSTRARKEAVAQRPSVKQNTLQRQVNRLESTLEEVEAEREAAVAERDEIASERDEYREEAERLAERVSDLESELERVRSDLREARKQLPDGEQVLSPGDALAGTNLFIRYDTQGGATLTKAHDGEVDREELAGNLRVEHHTTFDDGDVIVDGEPFREFLTGTMEYGFTEWLVTELPFEIRETGNVSALRDLYDAIPEIDRAEIGGSVPVEADAEGDDDGATPSRTFDLVFRDRMGEPLFVADLNDSRDPTAQATLEDLVRDASRLAESKQGFATGFAVTASFFEPGALETVDDATGSGLLSRGKQKSYVRVSRKQGFHMCLAESRDGGFHLTVPEL